MVARDELGDGLIGPDFGLISRMVPARMRPGRILAPAVMLDMPRVASWTGTDAPPRPATGFGSTSARLIGSGTGELVERYSAAIIPDAFPPIPPDERLDVDTWLPFTDEQYDATDFPFVRPYAVGDIAYTWSWNPLTRERLGVPADLVHLRPTASQQWCTISSNGLAAHRNAGAAARAAVFELIERDCFLRAWYGGHSHPTTTLDDVTRAGVWDPDGLALAERTMRAGVKITFVRMPATGSRFGVLACARSDDVGLAVGCAAKTSIREALRSAFIESVHTHNWAANIDTALFSGSMDSLEAHIALHADIENRPLNEFIDKGPRIRVDDFLDAADISLQDALANCARSGWTVLLADAASSDVRKAGWHVIRALSPQAVTLDVSAIHKAQHPIIRNATPHPFP